MARQRQIRNPHPAAAACSPSPASRSSVGEQVAEAQIVSQFQECCKVAYAGPHPLIPPAPYRVGVRSETAVHLRPRQAGLLLEPLQAMGEVVGKDVGSSAVVCTLSRHGTSSPSAQPETLSSASASVLLLVRLRPWAVQRPFGTLASPVHMCLLLLLPPIGPDRSR